MPSIGDMVTISGTGTFWDGKSGKVEAEHPDGSCTVAVVFGDGNETAQDFDGNYLEVIATAEGGSAGKGEDEGLGKGSKRMDKRKRKIDEASADEGARREALADYLGIDIEDIEVVGGDEFDTPKGDYLVLTEDEAYDRALEDIQETIDDVGLGAFTENFRDYIIYNLLDDYHIKEEVMIRDYEDYVEDLEREPSDRFGNLLIEGLYEDGFLDDDDFEDGEDGKNYYMLKPSVDLDELKYDYAKSLVEDTSVFSWLYDMGFYRFGGEEEAMYDWLEENEYIDWDAVKEQCIRDDGVAHFIANYDGRQIELDGEFCAYRIN